MQTVTVASAALMAEGDDEMHFHNVRVVVPAGGVAVFGASTVGFGGDGVITKVDTCPRVCPHENWP